MTFSIALAASDWDRLVETLERPVETAGVLIARAAETPDGWLLLVREVRFVPESAYRVREPYRLEIASPGYVPALGAAHADGSVAVFFHSHPGGDPEPSELDRGVNKQLESVFRLRTHQPLYCSLILGGIKARPSFTGTLTSDELPEAAALSRIRVVGDQYLILTRDDDAKDAQYLRRLDRQIRAFGSEGQRLLSTLHVGVVWLGATGSAVCEELLRLGVGQLTLLDDDVVEESNLSRIHEAGLSDVGTPKVQLFRARAREISPTAQVHAHQERLRSESACRRLVACDVVFGCTDDAFGRGVLARLAYWYLIPVIDMGFIIDVRQNSVHGLFGRVTVLQVGNACLLCRGRLSPQDIALEAMSPAERQLRAAEGYAPGLGEPDPSVVSYTTLIGSLAVSEMLSRLFIPVREAPSELLVRVVERSISRNRTAGKDGHFCVDKHQWGLGDEHPMLGQIWPQ